MRHYIVFRNDSQFIGIRFVRLNDWEKNKTTRLY